MKRWGSLTACSVLKRCQRGRLLIDNTHPFFHNHSLHKERYISSPLPGSPFRKVASSSIKSIVGIEDSWHEVLLQAASRHEVSCQRHSYAHGSALSGIPCCLLECHVDDRQASACSCRIASRREPAHVGVDTSPSSAHLIAISCEMPCKRFHNGGGFA